MMGGVDRTSPEFRSYVELYDRASLLELGQLADDVRWKLHPEQVVTYIIDRNINYTNVCVADCKFCAFYRRPKHPEGYLLSYDEIVTLIRGAGKEPVERDSLYQTVRTFEGYVAKPQAALVRPQGPAPQGALFQIEHRTRAAARAKQPVSTVVDGAE